MSQQLEDRFYGFAVSVRDFCAAFEYSIINKEYISQLVRPSASVAANYIEASDNLGKSDERMKLRISRREAKESILWLRLLFIKKEDLENQRASLINEAEQIRKILSAIINKLG